MGNMLQWALERGCERGDHDDCDQWRKVEQIYRFVDRMVIPIQGSLSAVQPELPSIPTSMRQPALRIDRGRTFGSVTEHSGCCASLHLSFPVNCHRFFVFESGSGAGAYKTVLACRLNISCSICFNQDIAAHRDDVGLGTGDCLVIVRLC